MRSAVFCFTCSSPVRRYDSILLTVEPSLKRGDVASDQCITCADCETFAELAGRIRGPTWERERGLRHFYTVGRHLRKSDVGIRCSVPPEFFPVVHDDCANWLDHLAGVVGRGDRNAAIGAHLA